MPSRDDAKWWSVMPGSLRRLTGYATEPLLRSDEIHRVVEGPTSTLAEARGEVVVVSWNIAYGLHYEAILEVLSPLEPDICLLQEVDLACRRSGYRNVAADLAVALGRNWIFAGEFQEIGLGRDGVPALTGQAILSRYPLRHAGVIPFSAQAKARWHLNPLQPRRGARMALRAETAAVRLYNLHAESGKNDAFRRRQVAEVVAAERLRAPGPGPVIVGGDFNSGRGGHEPLLDALRGAGFADPFDTHPATRRTSIRHRHALDWMFVRGAVPAGAVIAHHNDASDHFPLVVRLRLPPREWHGQAP